MDTQKVTKANAPFWMAIAPLLATTVILMVQFFVFNDFTPHIPLAIGILLCGLFARFNGMRWNDLESSMLKVVSVGIPAIFILMSVGMLISALIAAGTVPTLIYYGFGYLSAGSFLVVTCLISSVISLATGTSWGTVGTVGLALMGVGEGLGVPAYMTGGALVSGAFFGDKMSPLSETTNLTPAVCGTDLWSHIRGMMATTIPAMLIALGLYAWLGSGYSNAEIDTVGVDTIRGALENKYQLGLVTMIAPLVIIVFAFFRAPALPTMFVGVSLACAVAVFQQGYEIKQLFKILQDGYVSTTGIDAVDKLLSKGGLMSMTWVITLTLLALGFVGAIEACGALKTLSRQLDKVIKGRFTLVLASHSSVLAVATLIGDVYTSLVLPSRLLKDKYAAMGYKPTVLSRSVEDCGTLCSPLIPWNMGGAFVSTTIGVPTVLYAPFAFACWLSPMIGLLWALLGKFMPRTDDVPVDRPGIKPDANKHPIPEPLVL